MQPGRCLIGCAGWTLPRAAQGSFPAAGSHLQRYAARLRAVEINSSFYRPHAPAVWRRWADSVPAGFVFCVKLPRSITHERRLVAAGPLLEDFMQQARLLGEHLGCLLVQLPPSLVFDADVAGTFFTQLRSRWPGALAVEPRHGSWFGGAADALLMAQRASRVLADPVRHDAGRWPGGWPQPVYLRLHGSPRMYYSPYEPAVIAALAQRIETELAQGRDVWCIFDNTAAGAATDNALALARMLQKDLD